MPRTDRIYLDYTPYHIITRGNQRQRIFRDDDDFRRYLNMVKRTCKKYEVNLYGYCLMPNHVRLLAEPKKCVYLSKWMHWVNRDYSAYFNTKYGLVGYT